MIDKKDFLPQLRAAMKRIDYGFGLDEAFVHAALTGIGSPPSRVLTGQAASVSEGGLTYETVGWDGTEATAGRGSRMLVVGDPAEVAVSMFASFLAEIASRRFIMDHDVFEFRVYPEAMLRNYGCQMSFYARLVSYTSPEAEQATQALAARPARVREAV